MKKTAERCCGRAVHPKEARLDETTLDAFDLSVLEISRYYWQTFAYPQAHSWLDALQTTADRFPHSGGLETGIDVLAAVQAMRSSRCSCFHFNNPRCAGCSAYLSEHERQFISILSAVRHGRMGQARTHAMLLCEGNPVDQLIARMVRLAERAPAP